jgi:hypothetical protein
MADFATLAVTVGFVLAVIGTVNLDRWLDRRRARRLRNQARPMIARRAAARWRRA